MSPRFRRISSLRGTARVNFHSLSILSACLHALTGYLCAKSIKPEFDPTTTLALRLGDSVVQCASLTNTLSDPGDD